MSPRFSIRPLTALGDRRLAELAAELKGAAGNVSDASHLVTIDTIARSGNQAVVVALVDRYVWDLYFEKKKQTPIPHFPRQLAALVIYLIALLAVPVMLAWIVSPAW